MASTHYFSLTRFTFNAAARCSAPASPIPLLLRFSVVTVCKGCHHGLPVKHALFLSYSVHFQCSSQMLSACSPDPVCLQIQCCDCLQRLSSWPIGKARSNSFLTRFTFNAAARCLAPVGSIEFWGRSSAVSICNEFCWGITAKHARFVLLGSPSTQQPDAQRLHDRSCLPVDSVS